MKQKESKLFAFNIAETKEHGVWSGQHGPVASTSWEPTYDWDWTHCSTDPETGEEQWEWVPRETDYC